MKAMTALTQTRYNAAGELLADRSLVLHADRYRDRIQGPPSFQKGMFHYFEFKADSPEQLLAKLQVFVDKLDAARGKIIRYEDGLALKIPGYRQRLIARILYVVE